MLRYMDSLSLASISESRRSLAGSAIASAPADSGLVYCSTGTVVNETLSALTSLSLSIASLTIL